MRTITAAALVELLEDRQELALLDVREPGQYGEGHPFLAVNLPYSALAAELTGDVALRTQLNTTRFTGSIIASLVGVVLGDLESLPFHMISHQLYGCKTDWIYHIEILKQCSINF